MKILTAIGLTTAVMTMGLALAPRLKADTWDHLTKVTVNEPVEIPGQVLPAGTYWFKLLDSQTDRNIVQIYNANQSKEIALILAIPDFRLKPTGKTVITFEERAANSPRAIKAWFFPGDNYGQEFVYPKVRAVQLAQATNENVPSMPSNLEPNTKVVAKSPHEPAAMAMKNAPVKEEQPNGGEAELGATTPPQLSARNSPPPAPAPMAKTLPKTASGWPLATLAGLALLGAGFVLRVAARQLS